jgi:CHAD domain-containing protein
MPRKRLEPPEMAALKMVAEAELFRLAEALAGARPGESVHGARRGIKRLRSLLRLLKPALGETAFHDVNHGLRDAADSLAGLRRAEALVATAEKCLTRRDQQNGYWRDLAEAHRAARAAAVPADGGLHAARAALARAATSLGTAHLSDEGAQALSTALTRHYAKARRLLREGFASGTAEELHEARKFVIHHLHHLSLLSIYLAPVKKRLAALERLREFLGDLNDLDELAQHAAAQREGPQSLAARRMAKARARLLTKAEASAKRLFHDKPKVLKVRLGVAHWGTKR